MIQGTPDDKLKQLKDDLQRARAKQERQRTLRKAEVDTENQVRDEAARERHEDMMGQLSVMRELLSGQGESQAQHVGQMEQRHAEEVRRHETTLNQMTDLQAAVSSLRDERRAHSEQLAAEHVRGKADIKSVSEGVAEAREELESMAHELREDSARRHDELCDILLANASARESMSLNG
ncbi:hypothetical protein BC826DRAFT_1002680 [Russula brevipes]|nr:hypothetical protein BC826DRAFT_1002680 [Russula brevipes]